MLAIMEKNNRLLLSTATDFFKIGFIKGQNAEKAKQKRKRTIEKNKSVA
jgi:hypothetical protein